MSPTRPWRRAALLPRARQIVCVLLAVILGILAGGCQDGESTADPPIRIGIGSTAEQRTLAALTEVVLVEQGLPVVGIGDLGDSLDVREAALDRQVDVFWDYTGAAWTLALGRAAPSTDPQESFEAVQAADRGNDLRWLAPSGANATLSLLVRQADRPEGEAGTLTWLAGALATAPGGLCADADFLLRPSGFESLAAAYAISTDVVATRPLSEAKAITAVASGECFAGLATATSGQAYAAGLRALLDDQRTFPAFVVAPVVLAGGRADVDAAHQALIALATRIDTTQLAALNARVNAGEDPLAVAEEWLSGG